MKVGGFVRGRQFFEEYDARGFLSCKRAVELNFALVDRNEFRDVAESVGFRVTAVYGDFGSPYVESSPFMLWGLHT